MATRVPSFDPKVFLASIGRGRRMLEFDKKQAIFTQGDSANAVFYLQKGRVKLTVVSPRGKEATIGMSLFLASSKASPT